MSNDKPTHSKCSDDDFLDRMKEIADQYKTRGEAAEAAGVAKSTFGTWLDGSRSASFDGIRNFADVSGVSLDWLAFGPDRKLTSRDIGNRQIRRFLLSRIFVDYKALHKEFGYEEDEAETMRAVLDFYDDLVMFDDENVVTNMLASMMRWERQTLEKYKVKASKDN